MQILSSPGALEELCQGQEMAETIKCEGLAADKERRVSRPEFPFAGSLPNKVSYSPVDSNLEGERFWGKGL